ncbi:regulatory protein RecX [Aurantiacibacter suaedae]|uniref:regulatory protein RecX n=1 Tax=Aurantiacibacter suaedae TaxID=2545755 RepID=UPI001F4F9B66|nr:RecX family transcriptional regulator [Aurantiacibacter suaedae]
MNYVARFATSSGKLEAYLARKLRERGWDEGEAAPDIPALVADFVSRGYVDDEAYARARSEGLLARGYGARRVGEALRQAGIGETLREAASPGEAAARRAALRLAEKRRFGPFALEAPDQARREKQLAAMLRAGHSFAHARLLVELTSPESAREWAEELEDDDDDTA